MRPQVPVYSPLIIKFAYFPWSLRWPWLYRHFRRHAKTFRVEEFALFGLTFGFPNRNTVSLSPGILPDTCHLPAYLLPRFTTCSNGCLVSLYP